MKKLFIIPGFKEKKSDKQYQKLKKVLSSNGYEVLISPIDWNYKVLSGQVNQFKEFFNKNKSGDNSILGFSFGAMIALVCAKELNPNKLFLCSLSPYFKEDLDKIPQRWKNLMGKKRINDFSNISFSQAVLGLQVETKVFLGELEARKFSVLEKRCMAVQKKIPQSQLIRINNAPHDIGNEHYIRALQKNI